MNEYLKLKNKIGEDVFSLDRQEELTITQLKPLDDVCESLTLYNENGDICEINMIEFIVWSINEALEKNLGFQKSINVKIQNTKTYVRNSPKVGANDLCPCGSGKKYKRCCK